MFLEFVRKLAYVPERTKKTREVDFLNYHFMTV